MNEIGQEIATIAGRTDGSYQDGYDNQNDIGHPAWPLGRLTARALSQA